MDPVELAVLVGVEVRLHEEIVSDPLLGLGEGIDLLGLTILEDRTGGLALGTRGGGEAADGGEEEQRRRGRRAELRADHVPGDHTRAHRTLRLVPTRLALALASCLLVLLACGSAPGGPGEDRPPNIVFVIADQLRGDFLGCAGNLAASTPHLDRLAAEGAFFRHAYSSTPSCTPARAAILTGRSPWGHGMLGYHRVRPRYENELPRLLGAAGWTTHVVGKNHFHPQRNDHGYQSVELDESGRVESEEFVSDYRAWFARVAPDLDPDATGLGWNDYRAGVYALPEELHPTAWTADRAVAFLDERGADAAPFLLKVSFARPHSPYDPPARFLDRIDPGLVPPPFAAAWSQAAFGDFRNPDRHTAARNALPVEVALESRRHYLASLAFVDEAVGRVVDALERSGELDRTVILFTSDHGDMLGDHHLWRKTYAYEGSARIPWIVWWGSGVAALRGAARGQVREEPVELRDVLPSFLDVAGLEGPASIEGVSTLPLLRDDGGEVQWRSWIDLEHATCYWPENVWNALTDGRTKYVYHAFDGREQLFDLTDDPGETIDLAGDPAHAAELTRWRARMLEHLRPRGAPWVTAAGELGKRPEKILLRPRDDR